MFINDVFRIESKFEYFGSRMFLFEHLFDELVHAIRTTVNIKRVRIIKLANTFQDILSDITTKPCPASRRSVQNIVQLHPVPQLFKLLLQDDIRFCFVGEQQDHLDVLVRHICYFSDHLVARSYSTAACDQKDPFKGMFLPL